MKPAALRISAVSYINSLPFVYGIQHSGFLKNYSLSLDVPSVCANKLLKEKTDIGLAPIAIIPRLKEYFIFPGFCIGADGPVQSVMLYSEVPLKEIKTIYLDYQSKTSVILLKILAKHFWKISPEWKNTRKGYENKIKAKTAGLVIGDRNFLLKKQFNHSFDLSEQWKLFTGLPFVFACWITNKNMKEEVAASFYKALKYGIENKEQAIKQAERKYNPILLKNYINNYINYNFDRQKQVAMDLFLKLGRNFAKQP